MKVVYLTALRRGGLRRDSVWVERAFPDRRWVIAAVQDCEDGSRRVVIEPVEDRTLEAVYSESYFKRHFIPVANWLKRENERVLKQARRRASHELLTEMAHMNSRRRNTA